MAPKSKNPKIAIKNPDLRQYISGQFKIPQILDSGSGIAAGSICELTSGKVKLGTEQNTAFLGITRNAVGTDDPCDVEWGFVPCKLGSPVAVGDRIAPRASGYVGKAQSQQVSLLDATAGGNFANQPANDGIEVISDSAGDTTQSITLIGTLNGAATVIVTETLSLNGTTQVVSSHTNWGVLLAARLSAACAGTITIREASGNATITTISASNLTAGIATATSTQAYGLVPRRDGSGASTAYIGALGTGLDGAALYVAAAMDGTTEGDFGSTPFATVTEWYIGAVASTVNVNCLTNEASDASVYCGVALQTSTVAGVVIDCYIKPYWM